MAISTVGPGKEYTSLTSWESTEQKDLVTATDGEIAECYGGSNLGAVTIAGWTTNDTYYVTIRAASGEKHNGTWDTSKAHLISGADGIIIVQSFTRVEGMQIQLTGDDNSIHGITTNTSGLYEIYIDDCIIRGNPNMTTYGYEHTGVFVGVDRSTPAIIRNCLIYDFAVDTINRPGNTEGCGVRQINGAGLQTYVYNCTIINCDNGITDAYSDISARNNLVSGSLNACFNGGFNAASNYNVSSDATAVGTNNWRNENPSFTDVASRDYSLASSQYQAEDLSGATYGFTDDILGVTRSDWNAGAFEFVSVVPPGPITTLKFSNIGGFTGIRSIQF